MTKLAPYQALCARCSDVIPDVLLCPHPEPLCPGCCLEIHPRRCPDCLGQGHIPCGRDRWGYPLFATCATCEGVGRINTQGGSE